jgi:hypothetical protein
MSAQPRTRGFGCCARIATLTTPTRKLIGRLAAHWADRLRRRSRQSLPLAGWSKQRGIGARRRRVSDMRHVAGMGCGQPPQPVASSTMSRPDASEFLPLPFFPFEELPRNTPIDIEDAATAMFLSNGDLDRAAERLRVTPARLMRTIRKSPRLQRLQAQLRIRGALRWPAGRSAGRGPLVGHQRGQQRGEFRRASGHLSVDPWRRVCAARGSRLLGEPLQRRVGQLSAPIQVAGRGFGDGRDRSADGRLALLGRHVHPQLADR